MPNPDFIFSEYAKNWKSLISEEELEELEEESIADKKAKKKEEI